MRFDLGCTRLHCLEVNVTFMLESILVALLVQKFIPFMRVKYTPLASMQKLDLTGLQSSLSISCLGLRRLEMITL